MKESTKDKLLCGPFGPFDLWPYNVDDFSLEEEQELNSNQHNVSIKEETLKNNDGRKTCFWCGAPTKSVPSGFVANYNICTKCGK